MNVTGGRSNTLKVVPKLQHLRPGLIVQSRHWPRKEILWKVRPFDQSSFNVMRQSFLPSNHLIPVTLLKRAISLAMSIFTT